MHRTYRVDVTVRWRAGSRSSSSVPLPLRSHGKPIRRRDWLATGPGVRSAGRSTTYARWRAAGGGDWGPWLTTAGIWRPVEAPPVGTLPSLLRSARVDFDRTGPRRNRGSVAVHGVERSWMSAWRSTVRVARPRRLDARDVTPSRRTVPSEPGLRRSASTPGGQRWWPRGHGDQPRYRLDVKRSARREGSRTRRGATRRLPQRRLDTRRRDRVGVHVRRQRATGLRPRRQLDPRRPVPVRGHRRSVPGAARRRRSRRRPACASGAAASTRATPSTTRATSSASSSGRTSLRLRRVPRARCWPPRSKPRPARTSPG